MSRSLSPEITPGRVGGKSRRAFALVTVVLLMALLMIFVISLFQYALSERNGAITFRGQQELNGLHQAALNLVLTQLRNGTTQRGENWVSQPGALRRFGENGIFQGGHRLYSSDVMLVADELELASDRAPDNWEDRPDLWCDLNAPVFRGGKPDFPILDPAAMVTGVGHGPIEGFSIDAAFPGATITDGEDGMRAPMPVRWMYMLRDGHFGVIDDGGFYQGPGTPSKENPIVGRMAFWADDETCKLNTNTASDGTFWDTPRMQSAHATSQGTNQSQVLQDRAYGKFQPAQREYQRYPGHPAMTSLVPVLFPDAWLSPASKEIIYRMIPRLVGGGSLGGSAIVSESTGLITDADRLYAQADEWLFQPDRTPHPLLNPTAVSVGNFFLTPSSRAPETTAFGTPRVSVWPTHVREKNASNQPYRTAYDNLIRFCSSVGQGRHFYGFQRDNSRSPTSDWVDINRNRELLRYLQHLTNQPVPGYDGPSMAEKIGARDRDQLLVQILDYIRSTNLYDDNLKPNKYPNATTKPVQFTSGRKSWESTGDTYSFPGHGEVTPLRVPEGLGDTYPVQPDTTSHMGFGRFFTISEAGMLFICCADGSTDGVDGIDGEVVIDDKDGKYGSNVATNRTLGGTLLLPNQKRLQMMVFFEWTSPAQGWTQIQADFSLEAEQVGGTFRLDGQDLGIPTLVPIDIAGNGLAGWGIHHWGGCSSYRGFLGSRFVPARGVMPADSAAGKKEYGLISMPVTVDTTDGVMNFTGPEKLLVRIYSGTGSPNPRHLVQTIELHFPEGEFPIPELVANGTNYDTPGGLNSGAALTFKENWWTFHSGGPGLTLAGNTAHGRLGNGTGPGSSLPVQRPNQFCGSTIRPEDTLRTLVPYHGDTRLVAASHYVPVGVFQPSSFYFDTNRANAVKSHISGSAGSAYDWVANYQTPNATERLVSGANYAAYQFPDFPLFTDAVTKQRRTATPFQAHGDFDNGIATTYDGAYINKPDDGNTYRIAESGGIPYFSENWRQLSVGESFFSPNRLMPGPGMIGSLPVKTASGNTAFDPQQPGAVIGAPWRTLLFRPQTGHPGAEDPPDHLWLDLFWMPVVEPYAVSEPFSTAGKVNLNYQMIPFPHIRRATALHGVFRSEEMLILNKNQANVYKGSTALPTVRYMIDPDTTLSQFDEAFAEGRVFHTASGICDVHLVPLNHPASPTVASMENGSFWNTHALTGDNVRERTYTNLATRLTVRSNTFRVQIRVQTIHKARSTEPGRFDPVNDQVTGDWRGQDLVERYINPDDSLPDHALDFNSQPLDSFYRFRVVESSRF
jgi:uncharacterized protein (TIGR02600 family)